MGKINASSKRKKKGSRPAQTGKKSGPDNVEALLQRATILLQEGQAEEALKDAEKALKYSSSSVAYTLTVYEILGEIYIEIGDSDRARDAFLKAADIELANAFPHEATGRPDKYLWLAQLSETGGKDSLNWFERGCSLLRASITEHANGPLDNDTEIEIAVRRRKLANALCGAAELYMTDLSWEDDAEVQSEALATEACAVSPNSPEPLQTLASVRISQQRQEDARDLLKRSLEIWVSLPPEDPSVPDFPTRISLARLLMEVELEQQALDVLDRLVTEDDSSVEAWYLGGWCLYLIAGKTSSTDGARDLAVPLGSDSKTIFKASRTWLLNSLKLYQMLFYEDERLKQHAQELVKDIATQHLGIDTSKAEVQDDEEDEPAESDEEWEDEDEDSHPDGEQMEVT